MRHVSFRKICFCISVFLHFYNFHYLEKVQKSFLKTHVYHEHWFQCPRIGGYFIREIVRQSSAAGMDPFDRMQTAVDYIEKKHPRYLANGGTYLYTFAAEPSNELWFKSWWFDSLTTPTILCAIAKEIGGFDKISNLYYDGNRSEHWYARVTIGNQTKDYTFCPDVSTGDIGEIRKINFMDTSKMTKIY
mgnify:FL=1